MSLIGIYKITNPKGKIYIGQSRDLDQRKKYYKNPNNYKKHQPKLFNSIKKYGWRNHIFEIIEECDFDQLNIKERYWQDFYNVLSCIGLNCVLVNTDKLPRIYSEEVRESMRISQTGKKHNIETKFKMSESHKGLNTWMIGTKALQETINKRINTFKIRKCSYKPVIQYDLQDNFIKKWENQKMAAQELDIWAQNIGKCCLGKLNKAGGFKWKFAKEMTEKDYENIIRMNQ